MQPTRMAVGQEAIDLENQLVHEWRVTRLTGLGIPRPMAEVNADNVDWQQIASLVGAAAPRRWPCGSLAEPWLRSQLTWGTRRRAGRLGLWCRARKLGFVL